MILVFDKILLIDFIYFSLKYVFKIPKIFYIDLLMNKIKNQNKKILYDPI